MWLLGVCFSPSRQLPRPCSLAGNRRLPAHRRSKRLRRRCACASARPKRPKTSARLEMQPLRVPRPSPTQPAHEATMAFRSPPKVNNHPDTTRSQAATEASTESRKRHRRKPRRPTNAVAIDVRLLTTFVIWSATFAVCRGPFGSVCCSASSLEFIDTLIGVASSLASSTQLAFNGSQSPQHPELPIKYNNSSYFLPLRSDLRQPFTRP